MNRTNLKWLPVEEQFLFECIENLGTNMGIKRFQEEFPGRSYSSCYNKYRKINTTVINENQDNIAVEVKIKEVPDTPTKKKSFWTKILNLLGWK